MAARSPPSAFTGIQHLPSHISSGLLLVLTPTPTPTSLYRTGPSPAVHPTPSGGAWRASTTSTLGLAHAHNACLRAHRLRLGGRRTAARGTCGALTSSPLCAVSPHSSAAFCCSPHGWTGLVAPYARGVAASTAAHVVPFSFLPALAPSTIHTHGIYLFHHHTFHPAFSHSTPPCLLVFFFFYISCPHSSSLIPPGPLHTGFVHPPVLVPSLPSTWDRGPFCTTSSYCSTLHFNAGLEYILPQAQLLFLPHPSAHWTPASLDYMKRHLRQFIPHQTVGRDGQHRWVLALKFLRTVTLYKPVHLRLATWAPSLDHLPVRTPHPHALPTTPPSTTTRPCFFPLFTCSFLHTSSIYHFLCRHFTRCPGGQCTLAPCTAHPCREGCPSATFTAETLHRHTPCASGQTNRGTPHTGTGGIYSTAGGGRDFPQGIPTTTTAPSHSTERERGEKEREEEKREHFWRGQHQFLF